MLVSGLLKCSPRHFLVRLACDPRCTGTTRALRAGEERIPGLRCYALGYQDTLACFSRGSRPICSRTVLPDLTRTDVCNPSIAVSPRPQEASEYRVTFENLSSFCPKVVQYKRRIMSSGDFSRSVRFLEDKSLQVPCLVHYLTTSLHQVSMSMLLSRMGVLVILKHICVVFTIFSKAFISGWGDLVPVFPLAVEIHVL